MKCFWGTAAALVWRPREGVQGSLQEEGSLWAGRGGGFKRTMNSRKRHVVGIKGFATKTLPA